MNYITLPWSMILMRLYITSAVTERSSLFWPCCFDWFESSCILCPPCFSSPICSFPPSYKTMQWTSDLRHSLSTQHSYRSIDDNNNRTWGASHSPRIECTLLVMTQACNEGSSTALSILSNQFLRQVSLQNHTMRRNTTRWDCWPIIVLLILFVRLCSAFSMWWDDDRCWMSLRRRWQLRRNTLSLVQRTMTTKYQPTNQLTTKGRSRRDSLNVGPIGIGGAAAIETTQTRRS